jgi:hypothetical protein
VGDNFFKGMTDLFRGRGMKNEERLNRQHH